MGYKINNNYLHLADINYVCVKTVLDCTKMHQIKCKSQIFRGGGGAGRHALHPPLSLPHAKHIDITSPPPPPTPLSHYI